MSALAAAPIASRPAGPWRGLPADASSRVKFGIRAKITAGFGGIVLITATVGLFNLYTLAQVGTLSDTIYEDRVIPMRDLSQVRANVAESDTQMLRAIIDSSGVSVASAQGAVEKNSAEAERLIANYEQLIVVEDQRRALGTFRADWTQYQDASRVVLGALTSGDRSSALRLYSERATPLVSRLNADLAYLITVNVRSARATDDETDAANRRSLMITIPLLLLTVVLSSVIGLVLSGRIASTAQDVTSAARALARGELNRGVDAHSNDELGSMADALREMVTYQRQMAIVADAIANGDLSQDVEPQSQDDVLGLAFQRMSSTLRRTATVADAIAHGDLTQDVQPQSGEDVLGLAFQRMSMNLRQMVAELSAASQQLAGTGNEILAAVAQQSSGATEQSAAIAQTTATVDEVKASADQASQAASNVAESAEQTNRVAGEGVASVQEATNGMGDIHQKVQVIAENIQALSEQSQQIGDIITSVNDLADQSNLLALNAAIEASRAGEQGKGFAVVAAEIRNLAEQSKAATEQVRTILSDIQRATNATVMATEQGTRGVDAGSQAIDHVGQTIGELAEAIQQTAESAHQIAGSVRQHSIGMEQIAMAMSNINQATVQNLAATTDTEKAARNLTEVAHRINGLVAQYHV